MLVGEVMKEEARGHDVVFAGDGRLDRVVDEERGATRLGCRSSLRQFDRSGVDVAAVQIEDDSLFSGSGGGIGT